MEEVLLTEAEYNVNGELERIFFGWDKEFSDFLKDRIDLACQTNGSLSDDQIAEIVAELSMHMNLLTDLKIEKKTDNDEWQLKLSLAAALYGPDKHPAQEIIVSQASHGYTDITFELDSKIETYRFKIENDSLNVLILRQHRQENGEVRTSSSKKVALPLQLKKAAIEALANADLALGNRSRYQIDDGDDPLYWAGYEWQNIINVEYGRNLT